MSICQNCLDSVNLRLVFCEARLDRVNRQSRRHVLGGIKHGIGNVLHGGNAHDTETGELAGNEVNTICQVVKREGLHRLIKLGQTVRSTLQLKTLFELSKGSKAGLDTALELLVVELHL